MSDPVARPRASPADFVTIANVVCGFLALAVAARVLFAPHGAGWRRWIVTVGRI